MRSEDALSIALWGGGDRDALKGHVGGTPQMSLWSAADLWEEEEGRPV